jgi:hypothetical protein
MRTGRYPTVLLGARAGAIAVLAGMLAASAAGIPGTATPAVPYVAPAAAEHVAGGFAEHRYRIVGKVRLALFWVGRDNVGSARMTWRSDGDTTALALLVGSDPQRAPRNLNQWGYLREETRADNADVFMLRSLGADDKVPAAPIAAGSGPLVGVSCSSVGARDVTSLVTTVNGGRATYRMLDRLLDQVAATSEWQERHTAKPPGADAGFLTALQHLMRAGRNSTSSTHTIEPVTYVYNNHVYDLGVRESRALGPTTVGNRTFDRLTRTDFSVRSRTTKEVSKFAVTYAPDGGALPVQIFYQPSFWLSVELRLDDAVDVPADPAADGSVLTRIRAICGSAAPTTTLHRD